MAKHEVGAVLYPFRGLALAAAVDDLLAKRARWRRGRSLALEESPSLASQDQLSAELASLSAGFLAAAEVLDERRTRGWLYRVEVDNLNNPNSWGYIKDSFELEFESEPPNEEMKVAVVSGLRMNNWFIVAKMLEDGDIGLNSCVGAGFEGSLKVELISFKKAPT